LSRRWGGAEKGRKKAKKKKIKLRSTVAATKGGACPRNERHESRVVEPKTKEDGSVWKGKSGGK